MGNKNAELELKENEWLFDSDRLEENEDAFDFDALLDKLEETQAEEDELSVKADELFGELTFLEEEREKIGSPDALGETIKGIVWEQFINQIAVTAGTDFIKKNNNLTLDLRKEAHIQTTENFEQGKIATHNTEINYQERYDSWQSNFQRDENGNIITHKNSLGKEEATLVDGARKPFDEGRPRGSAERHTDMDHTVSAAEIIRDSGANAHIAKDDQVAFANSEANLYEMDASLNRSKGDKSTSDWLDNPNSAGQKPNEIFDISPEEEQAMRQKDEEAREEYEKLKKEGEQRSAEAGKKSRRQEAFRIGGKALRAVIMQLFAELAKEVIAKLVEWFKSANKKLETFFESLKKSVKSFLKKLKTHMVNAADTLVTTVATAIIGPVVGLIKKIWTMLKQGWRTLKDVVSYIKKPQNKEMPIDRLLMEIGKIVIAGATGIGAMFLGEVIEKALIAIPGAGSVFGFEIPMIGSLASLLGIFFGATAAGIIGAMVIYLLQKAIEHQRSLENTSARIDTSNKILGTQQQLLHVGAMSVGYTEIATETAINNRHQCAGNVIEAALDNIRENCKEDASIDGALQDIDNLFDDLSGEDD